MLIYLIYISHKSTQVQPQTSSLGSKKKKNGNRKKTNILGSPFVLDDNIECLKALKVCSSRAYKVNYIQKHTVCCARNSHKHGPFSLIESSSMALTKESHYLDFSKCSALWNSFTLSGCSENSAS